MGSEKSRNQGFAKLESEVVVHDFIRGGSIADYVSKASSLGWVAFLFNI